MIEAFIAIFIFSSTVAVIQDNRAPDVNLYEKSKTELLTKRAHCEQLKYGVRACWKIERVK